ncbi:crimpy [Carabus blaptoides fortunei]
MNIRECCKVCARTEGEPCGGVLGFSGECEPGLTCNLQGTVTDFDLDSSEGICQRDP